MKVRPTSLPRAAGALVTVLTGLLLALPVVLTTAAPAHACSCAVTGLRDQADLADVVVSGTVLQVRDGQEARDERPQEQERPRGVPPRQQVRPSEFGTVTLVIGVDRIYAGEVPDATIEVETAVASSACGLGRLPTDQRYFFFLADDGPDLRASSCGGSGVATPRQARAVTEVLGEGRPVDAVTTPRPVRRTVVGDPETTPVAVMAAPGGVLVGVGLLGLLVLAGLGRRSSGQR